MSRAATRIERNSHASAWKRIATREPTKGAIFRSDGVENRCNAVAVTLLTVDDDFHRFFPSSFLPFAPRNVAREVSPLTLFLSPFFISRKTSEIGKHASTRAFREQDEVDRTAKCLGRTKKFYFSESLSEKPFDFLPIQPESSIITSCA